MALSVNDVLLDWHNSGARDLPWKKTRDPYKIWLSEVILQQTRVEQGRPYYLKFVDAFPTVADLAEADPDDVLKLWEGLGYYSRARNLHAAARQVACDMNGVFPTDYASLRALKGVGDYTAAAIASFAYGEAVAVVDGNVYRFLSRIFGIADPIDTSAGKKKFSALAAKVLGDADPALHNQAIMDFGALVCTPRKPDCGECPFSLDCAAYNQDRIAILPVKSKGMKRKERSFRFHMITDGDHVILEKRSGRDIWQGLYQFPLLESGRAATGLQEDSPDTGARAITALLEAAAGVRCFDGFRQDLSHQRINATFTVVEVSDISEIPMADDWMVVREDELDNYAYPRIIRHFLEDRPW
jgi:A/G-specific adenine glycosylase